MQDVDDTPFTLTYNNHLNTNKDYIITDTSTIAIFSNDSITLELNNDDNIVMSVTIEVTKQVTVLEVLLTGPDGEQVPNYSSTYQVSCINPHMSMRCCQ